MILNEKQEVYKAKREFVKRYRKLIASNIEAVHGVLQTNDPHKWRKAESVIDDIVDAYTQYQEVQELY